MIDAKLMYKLNGFFDMMPTIPPNYFTLVRGGSRISS
jgi:hypothetical protein